MEGPAKVYQLLTEAPSVFSYILLRGYLSNDFGQFSFLWTNIASCLHSYTYSLNMSKLFQPLDVAGSHLQHRMVMAPLTRFRADDDYVPMDIVRGSSGADTKCFRT